MSRKKEKFHFDFIAQSILKLFVFPESQMVCINEKEEKYNPKNYEAESSLVRLSYFYADDLSKPHLVYEFMNHSIYRRFVQVPTLEYLCS